MLVFVVPVRHPGSVARWVDVQQRLDQTLASIARQQGDDWRIVVVGNSGTMLPALGRRTSVRWVDLPLPVLPDPAVDQEGLWEAIRHDKGRRVLAGLHDVDDRDYTMVVDYDDWVSRRLAGYVADHHAGSGWVLSTGFVYAGGHLLVGLSRFNDICGTSLILRRDRLDIVAGPERNGDAVVRRQLGSHRFMRRDLEERGDPLAVLPFPGAVYRVGVSDAVTGSKGLLRYVGTRGMLARHPWRVLRNACGVRPATRRMRDEFGLPAP
jgi:hypothetical protein